MYASPERRAVSLWAVPPRSIDETSTMLRVGAQTKNFEADPRPHHEHHRDLISNRTKDVRVNRFKFFVFFHQRQPLREMHGKSVVRGHEHHPQPRALSPPNRNRRILRRVTMSLANIGQE